jgi:hypothetical protein
MIHVAPSPSPPKDDGKHPEFLAAREHDQIEEIEAFHRRLTPVDATMVVCRYKEDLKWWDERIFGWMPTVLYNKGQAVII